MTAPFLGMPPNVWKTICNAAFLVSFFLTSTSCNQLEMDDVSSAPEYSAAVGARFRMREDVFAIGITAERNYQKKVDYIVLVPSPGFSGPEVVNREQIGKGSVIRVTRVLKAASLFSSKVAYVVELSGSDKFKDTQARVTLTGTATDDNFGLDKSIYEKMN